jgi:O-antigen/teichoic acid export membrane protein
MTSSISIEKKEQILSSRPIVDWKTIGHTLLMVISVVAGGMAFRALVYRSLGPEQSGLLAFTVSIFTLSSTVISLGLPVAVVKFIAARKTSEEGASYLLTGFRLMMIHSFVGFILLAMFIPMVGQWYELPQVVSLRWEIAICAVLAAQLSFYERSFNGMLNMKSGAAINLTNNIARLSFVLLFLSLGIMSTAYGLRAILFASILASGWGIKLIFDVRKQFPDCVKPAKKYVKGLYEYGLPQFGAVVLDQVSYHIGVILSAWFLSKNQVGIYSVAVLMASILWVGPSAIQMLTYPLMSEAWRHQDRDKLSQIIGFSVRICAVLLIPATFGLIYLRKDLIELVFGSQFLPAAEPLAVLACGYCFNAIISRPLGASMGALERPWFDMIRVVVSTSINVGGCLYLLPRLGILGAAWAVTISLIVTSLISYVFIIKLSGVKFSWNNFRITWCVLPVIAYCYLSIEFESVVWKWGMAIGISLLLLLSGWWIGLTKEDRQLVLKNGAGHHGKK